VHAVGNILVNKQVLIQHNILNNLQEQQQYIYIWTILQCYRITLQKHCS